jgi:hypothetical protein
MLHAKGTKDHTGAPSLEGTANKDVLCSRTGPDLVDLAAVI